MKELLNKIRDWFSPHCDLCGKVAHQRYCIEEFTESGCYVCRDCYVEYDRAHQNETT